MIYKKGDIVRVKETLVGDEHYGKVYFNPEMEIYRGKVYKIKTAMDYGFGDTRYTLEDVSRVGSGVQIYWRWSEEMLSPAAPIRHYEADLTAAKNASESFFSLLEEV